MQHGHDVTCDICGKDIVDKDGKYTLSKDKQKVDGDVILIKSICCPHCGAKYPYIVTDKETRRLIRQRERYIKQICGMIESGKYKASDEPVAGMLEQNRKMGAEIKAKTDALKEQYILSDNN